MKCGEDFFFGTRMLGRESPFSLVLSLLPLVLLVLVLVLFGEVADCVDTAAGELALDDEFAAIRAESSAALR